MKAAALSLVALFIGGCWTPSGAARQRHSREYGCPESEIQLEDVGSFAYRATGCGHQVTYQCADNSAYSGTWCIPVGENTAGGLAGAGSGPSSEPSAEASRQQAGVGDPATRLEEGTARGERALRLWIPSLGASLLYAPGIDRDAVVVQLRASDGRLCQDARLVGAGGEPRVARPGDDGTFRLPRDELDGMEQSEQLAIILCGASAQLHGDDAATFRRFVVRVRELAGTSPSTPVASEPAGAEVRDTRSWLDAHREVILGCVARATVVVRVEPGDGSARVSLQTPLAGTPEEDCVRAALGAPPATAIPRSTVIHAVR